MIALGQQLRCELSRKSIPAAQQRLEAKISLSAIVQLCRPNDGPPHGLIRDECLGGTLGRSPDVPQVVLQEYRLRDGRLRAIFEAGSSYT